MADDARVAIYDTTLRDGTQREGLSLTATSKLRVARALDALGVAYVEGGFPASNPKDAELFRRARDVAWTHAILTAFGSTRRAGVPAEEDAGLLSLLEAGTAACTIFGKSSAFHVRDVLRTTLDENLRMIEESVALLVARERRVVYDAEHFFDGAREDGDYALETLAAAVRGGASAVVLCDTNGGTLPWEVEERVRWAITSLAARGARAVDLGIHAHDDGGCAVANSLAAVRAGATHVQGTMNGYGERCGNANLAAIVPSLELKLGKVCLRPGALPALGEAARVVADAVGIPFDEHAPYFGRSAFAHKGGVHVAAIRRARGAYEHVDPALVGNRTRVVVSELAGRQNVEDLAERHDLATPGAAAAAVLARVKEQEAKGFSFDGAEASVALLLRRERPDYAPPFEILDYKVLLGRSGQDQAYADAAVKVRVGDDVFHTAAEGSGPVSALDGALRKALGGVYPAIHRVRLLDYRVGILDGREGTAATTRVLVDHGDGREQWTTVGASPSIVEASVVAVVDGIEHGLWLDAARARDAASPPLRKSSGVSDAGEDRSVAR